MALDLEGATPLLLVSKSANAEALFTVQAIGSAHGTEGKPLFARFVVEICARIYDPDHPHRGCKRLVLSLINAWRGGF